MGKTAAPTIEVEELHALGHAGAAFLVLDVREPWEQEVCAISGSRNVPMNEVPGQLGSLPADRPLVVLCHHGMRSRLVADWLRARGLGNAVNLAGGIDAWADRIDQTMRRY
jgi:rhodanese-related sulfurtransferase